MHTQTFHVPESPLTCGNTLYLTLYKWVEERSTFGNNLAQKLHVVKSILLCSGAYRQFSLHGLKEAFKIYYLGDFWGPPSLLFSLEKGTSSCCHFPPCYHIHRFTCEWGEKLQTNSILYTKPQITIGITEWVLEEFYQWRDRNWGDSRAGRAWISAPIYHIWDLFPSSDMCLGMHLKAIPVPELRGAHWGPCSSKEGKY